jgi:hypothetical protein
MKQSSSVPSRVLRALAARAALGVVLFPLLGGCRDGGPRARAEAASLRRQIQGLRELLADTEKHGFFSANQLAIGIRAELLRDLLRRQLPLETVVGGRIRVRLERAEVSLESGQSLVTLQGRVSSTEGAADFADLELLGGLHRFEVQPRSGLLTARLELDRVEVQRLAAGSLERGFAQALSEALGGRSLGALGEVLPRLEIPLRLDQAVEFGGFAEGVVSVPPQRLGVRVSVARVAPLGGRLWVLLDVDAGDTSEPGAVGQAGDHSKDSDASGDA